MYQAIGSEQIQAKRITMCLTNSKSRIQGLTACPLIPHMLCMGLKDLVSSLMGSSCDLITFILLLEEMLMWLPRHGSLEVFTSFVLKTGSDCIWDWPETHAAMSYHACLFQLLEQLTATSLPWVPYTGLELSSKHSRCLRLLKYDRESCTGAYFIGWNCGQIIILVYVYEKTLTGNFVPMTNDHWQ